jgi:hypothetical protein
MLLLTILLVLPTAFCTTFVQPAPIYLTAPADASKAVTHIDSAEHMQNLAGTLMRQNSRMVAAEAENFREKMIQHLVNSAKNSAAFRQSDDEMESEELTER